MRTKLMLGAVALAAGLATSMAQTYSQNVVGYVNQTYDAGFHMVANPLDTTNNTIAAIIPAPPLFTAAFKFSGGSFGPANSYLGAWTDPNMTMNPGEGLFLYTPSNCTNTYVGEVQQGLLVNPLVPGYNVVGTEVPQAGGISTVHSNAPSLFDAVYQWDDPNKTYFPVKSYLGVWSPSEPNIAVAEGFWYYNAGASTNNWTRNFTVQ